MTTPKTWPANALWHVTTEGDCEGRTTRDLGVHLGHLDDVAFSLAPNSCYKLQFDLVDPSEWSRLVGQTEVNVSLGIASKTWDLRGPALESYFRAMLAGRDVSVASSNYHASVRLVRGLDPKRQEEARCEMLRASALAKLTDEERDALIGRKP